MLCLSLFSMYGDSVYMWYVLVLIPLWSFLTFFFFFFKQKTAYEMRISDWSSDVCSSDLGDRGPAQDEDLDLSRRAHHVCRDRQPAEPEGLRPVVPDVLRLGRRAAAGRRAGQVRKHHRLQDDRGLGHDRNLAGRHPDGPWRQAGSRAWRERGVQYERTS